MTYSYDRTASEKKWHDILGEAQSDFMDKAVKELAKLLKGKAQMGSFANGLVTYGDQTVSMGFIGGSIGTVFVLAGPKQKRTEHSVVNHTPSSLATFLVNSLKLK